LHHEIYTAETRVIASVSQIGVVISEIQHNKLKAAKSLKSGFRRRFEDTTVASRFKLIERSTIT